MQDGMVFDENTGEYLGNSYGSEYYVLKTVEIVLTIAHLDHQPENCDPDNLRAWCQRCHNRYDAPHRRRNAAARRSGDITNPHP